MARGGEGDEGGGHGAARADPLPAARQADTSTAVPACTGLRIVGGCYEPSAAVSDPALSRAAWGAA
ncbi:MAG: hypothetical protein HBSAPP03_00290 [Phycisphaerae bacterium]|nr:MAG: hypothetical protein HBSAPP03_00290 [Phycisphaerae bacterium]